MGMLGSNTVRGLMGRRPIEKEIPVLTTRGLSRSFFFLPLNQLKSESWVMREGWGRISSLVDSKLQCEALSNNGVKESFLSEGKENDKDEDWRGWWWLRVREWGRVCASVMSHSELWEGMIWEWMMEIMAR